MMRAAIATTTLLISLLLASVSYADTPPAVVPATLGASPGNNCAARYYPAEAIRNGEQGASILNVHIDETGKPVAVDVTASSGYAVLDDAARSCVLKAWHFQPATLDGKPVAVTKTYKIVWKLMGGDFPCGNIPDSANAAFVGKTVLMAYRVDTNGNVMDPFVISSSNDNAFDAVALQCVARITYNPAPQVITVWGGAFLGTLQGPQFINRGGVGKTCDSSAFPPDILKQPADYAAAISFEATLNAAPTDLIFERSSGSKPFDDAALACVKAWRYTSLQPDAVISVDAKIVAHHGQLFVLSH